MLSIITKLKAGMLPDYHKPDIENKKNVEKYQIEELYEKINLYKR